MPHEISSFVMKMMLYHLNIIKIDLIMGRFSKKAIEDLEKAIVSGDLNDSNNLQYKANHPEWSKFSPQIFRREYDEAKRRASSKLHIYYVFEF